ncbi:PRKCSH [Lepeophtheirus salmonis]|uniref:PRKCSH n=1 Tax=Lepeophtheirus salmonis TaxID=72036 RepID=A0A7R8D486_LEPSM|nr:PRKCSH [Lepeophtheirus salmonis]CAF3021800.1 PRKCSH [Lepeophtheirus salmonis]
MRLMLQLVFIGALFRVSGGSTDPRGVDPDFVSFYDSAKNFQCLDGSSIIDYRKVNDDYCDCEDGSDEPGTSACPNGSFFCHNMGFMQSRIPSSRVNDGICDCCDGSDEEQRMIIIEEGLKLKEGLVLSAQKIYSQKTEELVLRENELKEFEAQRSTSNSIKESAETLERAALEVYKEIEEKERLMKEEEERLEKEEEFYDRFNNLDVNSDGNVEASELQHNIKFDQNNDGIVSEEEAAFYMSGLNSYDYETFKVQGWPLMQVVLESKGTPSKPIVEHDTDGGQKDGADYEDYNDEEDDVKPPHLKSSNEDTDEGEEEEEHLDKEEEETAKDNQEEATDNSVRYDTETQKLIDDANKARADYDHYDRKVKDIENDILHLRSIVDKDYGHQKEFLALTNEVL